MNRSNLPMNAFLLALFLTVVLVEPAHAYLDPGSGAMLAQLLFGGIAGVAVVFKMYWASIAAKFSKKKPDEPASAPAAKSDDHHAAN